MGKIADAWARIRSANRPLGPVEKGMFGAIVQSQAQMNEALRTARASTGWRPENHHERIERLGEVRRRLEADYAQDLEKARKAAWKAKQRPRLQRGESGRWWAVSEHPNKHVGREFHPVKVIGVGDTPRAAYDDWSKK